MDEFYEIIENIKKERIFALNSTTISSLSQHITFFHYIKSISMLDSIKILSQHNKINEMNIILRSLLNLYINIKWLTFKDAEERMQKYADFEIIGKKRKMDLSGIKSNNDAEKQKAKKIREQFEEIINKYNLNPRNQKDVTQWSGKSIYAMAKETGLLADYEKVYSYLSFEEHTGPSTVRHHLQLKNNISSYISNPNEFNNALALWTAISYYYEIEKITAVVFDVNFPNINVNLTELANRYLSSARKLNT